MDLRRVHSGHVADRTAPHADAWTPIRSIPIVPSSPIRAACERVQRYANQFSGSRQLVDVEPAGATHRVYVRSERRRQDGAEGQLRALLVEPRHRGRRRARESERGRLVQAVQLERREP